MLPLPPPLELVVMMIMVVVAPCPRPLVLPLAPLKLVVVVPRMAPPRWPRGVLVRDVRVRGVIQESVVVAMPQTTVMSKGGIGRSRCQRKDRERRPLNDSMDRRRWPRLPASVMMAIANPPRNPIVPRPLIRTAAGGLLLPKRYRSAVRTNSLLTSSQA